jgi:hypothetical protein
MPTTRPFAYNTGSTIPGAIQVGNLAIGVDSLDYSLNPGGVKWWMGADEDLGYIIAKEVPSNTQPTEIQGVTASVAFSRSQYLTEVSFIELTNYLFNQNFLNGNDAKTWLNNNGYWTSYGTQTSINYILLENSNYLLQESNFKIII